MNKITSTLTVLFSCLLIVAGWAIYRLVEFQQSSTEWITYIDAPRAQTARQALACRTATAAVELDISDFSYNVTESQQPAGLYRYKTNLEALPPVDVHVLVIEGGSGRVVVEDTGQPVWLALISTKPAIWHVDIMPGVRLERVVTSEQVSEIRFTRSMARSAVSLRNLLMRTDPVAAATPTVDVLPDSTCLHRLSRFQEHDVRRQHEVAIGYLRMTIGYPELSLQAAGTPSYFDRPFFVPFPEPQISPGRLAEVLRLAEPLANRQNDARQAAAPAPRVTPASEFEQYANMARNENTIPKTLASPAAFITLLEEYQRRDLLPSAFPLSGPGMQGLSANGWYSLSDYRNAFRREVPAGVTPDACNGGRERAVLIVEGGNESNTVRCSWGNQMYFMRGGNDDIDDSWQDDIINAGPGDDTIDAGWGHDLIFFNFGWGQDTVRKTCHDAAYIPQDTPRASTVNWSRDWPYKNFIVFGKDVRREDIVVIGDKLVHRNTGDSVEISGNCFNLVFWQ